MSMESVRFVGAASVMLHTTDDRSDRNFRICQDAKQRLEQSTDAKGRKLEIIEVPLDGDVSYLNFLHCQWCDLGSHHW